MIDVEFSHLVGMVHAREHSHCWIPPALMRPDNADGSDDAGSTAESLCGSGCEDYTQMNSKADEDVRKELNAMLTYQPAACLYWSINLMRKTQWRWGRCRTPESSGNAEQRWLPASRVYPGSSRQAYLANRGFMSYGKTEPFLLMKPGSMICQGSLRSHEKRLRL